MANIVDAIRKNEDLRKKIVFTLLMIAVYRIGVHIPTPGVDSAALSALFSKTRNIFGFFNMFSGGALQRFSILALGIMPYISSSIIFQLLGVISPKVEALQKEGGEGRKKITQWTRYLTIVLALIQGYGIAVGLESVKGGLGNSPVVLDPGLSFRIMTAITLCTGTAFLMWLGEQMTERGIGNGISMLIFAGIASSIPSGAASTWTLMQVGEIKPFMVLAVLVGMVLVIGGIIFMERAQRKIPVHYSKRPVGKQLVKAQNSHLPLRLNTAGVIPPIFASSLLLFPSTIATFLPQDSFLHQKITEFLAPHGFFYQALFSTGIVFFAYFYTSVIFRAKDVADNLGKQGGYIPGVRPGQKTEQFLEFILNRITIVGALYLICVCLIPEILYNYFKVPFYFGGTSLLILIGVALDTVAQVETFMYATYYEGFLKSVRLRGRRA